MLSPLAPRRDGEVLDDVKVPLALSVLSVRLLLELPGISRGCASVLESETTMPDPCRDEKDVELSILAEVIYACA